MVFAASAICGEMSNSGRTLPLAMSAFSWLTWGAVDIIALLIALMLSSVLSSIMASVSVSSYAVARIADCIRLTASFVRRPSRLNCPCSVGDSTWRTNASTNGLFSRLVKSPPVYRLTTCGGIRCASRWAVSVVDILAWASVFARSANVFRSSTVMFVSVNRRTRTG